MARTRAQNNIAKPLQRFSPSSTVPASKKTKAEPSASSAAAQDSTSGTKSKRKGKSGKKKETVSAQVEEEPEDGPQEEQDAAGGGPVVSAIRDEQDAPKSLTKKANSNKARGNRQKVGEELDKGTTGAHLAEGAAEASSSAVENVGAEEDNEPASSGSKARGEAKDSSKASRKPAKPRKTALLTPRSTGVESEKDRTHGRDDGADPSGSKHETKPNKASQSPERITKHKDRAAKSTRSTEPQADGHQAGDKDGDPGSSATKAEKARTKSKSASKSAAKSTRTKRANRPSLPAEKSKLDEHDNDAEPPAAEGKSGSKNASRPSSTKTKPNTKATKSKSTGSKVAQSATEEEDGKLGSATPTSRNESKAAAGNSTGAGIHATISKVKGSKESANEDRTEAPPDSIFKTALTKGRKGKKVSKVEGKRQDTAENSEHHQDGPRDDSNRNVRKPKKQATTSKATGSKRSADKSNSEEPPPSKIPGTTATGNRRRRKRPAMSDMNDETGPGQGHQDEASDDGNSRSRVRRQKVAAPKSVAKKIVGNSRALSPTNTPDDVDDPLGAKRKRGRGRPPKKNGKPAADPEGGEGSSAAAKGRGKKRRKPTDTTYRQRRSEDEEDDEARLSGDAEDEEGKDGPRKRRRVQDPTYRPDDDAWSEPSPLSEQNARVHPVRDRHSKEKGRNAPDSALHNAGYADNLLPPSERALHRSPDFDKRGKLGWRPSSRKKREAPGARRGEVTKAIQAKTTQGKTAQAESGDNDDPADDAKRAPSSASEGDQRQGANGSQNSGSEEGEGEHRSDRIAQLQASRLDDGGSRSSEGLSSQADTLPQPGKRDKPVYRMDRTAQTIPPRRPGDGAFRSQAGPAPQPSGIRGISGLSIPSVQPNTLKRPRKTAVELRKEERQRKRDAKRRCTENRDLATEETSSQQHPTVSFEDPAPGSQEEEAPQKRGQKRRHSSTVFASITDTRRTRSWPTVDNPASRRVPAETTNPPSPASARGNPQSEPEMSMNRMLSVAIPAMAVRDDAWSEVLRASSTTSGTADLSSDTSSSRASNAALPRPKKETFMDATINTAFSMFYRLRGIPWKSTVKEWREERAKERAAEKRREREKARKGAGKGDGNGKAKGRVTNSTRSEKRAAAKKGKGKQKEPTPEAEAPEGAGWEEGEEKLDELEEEEEELEEELAMGQGLEELTKGSMNTRKDSSENVLTITQTTTVKTPERTRSASNSISPQTRQAASILGALEHSAAQVGNPRQTTPLRQHGGQDGTGPSPRTLLLAQHMADLRQSGEGLQARGDDGGGQSGRESPLLGSDFDARSEERSVEGEPPDEAAGEEAPREDEGGGLTEDQGTTEDECREVQTPGEGDEGPILLGGGMFRMAQRFIGKSHND